MLWFVRVALKRPCTRVVVALENVRSGPHAYVADDDGRQRGADAPRMLDRTIGAWQLPTRQLRTGVDLIRALGGGWSAPDAAVAVAAVATTAPLRTTPHEWRSHE